KIRNRFAHTVAPIDFSDPKISTTCDDLIYPRLHSDIIGASAPHRERYLHSCWVLRALVTHSVMGEDKPDGPSQRHLLEVLAESLIGSSPHDKSSGQRPPHSQSEDHKSSD